MIKLVLLTGFLGAGKTTLLQNILQSFKEKTGVIVNDFGAVNVDAMLIQKEGVQMAELANGSIFCACIKDKFVDSLIDMAKMDLHYMFIEASGLADPSNMVEILDGIKQKTGDGYNYLGSIAVIDGENFVDLYEMLPAVHIQVEYCSAAIINKGDLIDEAQLGQVLSKVEEINPQAETYVTSFCQVDVRQIVGDLESSDKTERESRDSSNTIESRPSTFIVKGLKTVPLKTLEAFVDAVKEDTYRVKGFAITDQGNVEISAVGKHVNINPWKEPLEKTEIVVISAIGFKMMSVITRAISEHGKGILSI